MDTDRTNKDIQPVWQGPRSWDYGREVIVDDAKGKPSDKTARKKYRWDYELRAVTNDAKSKSLDRCVSHGVSGVLVEQVC